LLKTLKKNAKHAAIYTRKHAKFVKKVNKLSKNLQKKRRNLVNKQTRLQIAKKVYKKHPTPETKKIFDSC